MSTTHIRELVPDPHNRRAHNPRNIGMLVDSLQAVGAARSIVIDEHGVVLAGNGVIEAAAEAGIERVQVVDADGETIIAVRRSGLSDAQKRTLAIADNRVAELATWNVEQLKLDAVAGLDLEPFWTDRERAKMFGGPLPTRGHTDADDVPAPRATSVTVGDVFACGPHRVVCGDCTDPAVVAALVGRLVDAPVAMVWGDPPYGIALDQATADRKVGFYGGSVITEHAAPWDGVQRVDWIAAYEGLVAPGGYLAAWGPYQGIGAIEHAALAAGLVWLNLYTWIKENPPPGFPEYLTKSCEWSPIFRKPGGGRYIGPELVRDYLVAPNVHGEERHGHPSPKPVDVVRPVVGKLTPPGATVIDPFLGSGSTLIVAESIGRVCVGVELDPVYVQVTLDRWAAFTGQQPEKVGEVAA